MIVEPGVLVPLRYCATVAKLLDSLDRSQGGLPEGLEALRRECRQASSAAARINAAEACSVSGTSEVPEVAGFATLSVMETAQLIGCTDRNVRSLAARGSLRGRRAGGRWLFDPDDVAAWVAERQAS